MFILHKPKDDGHPRDSEGRLISLVTKYNLHRDSQYWHLGWKKWLIKELDNART